MANESEPSAELVDRVNAAVVGLSLTEMIALADGILLEVQTHRLAGPGWKGIRTKLQEFVRFGGYTPEPTWLSPEGDR